MDFCFYSAKYYLNSIHTEYKPVYILMNIVYISRVKICILHDVFAYYYRNYKIVCLFK